jgi:hypothetical protein
MEHHRRSPRKTRAAAILCLALAGSGCGDDDQPLVIENLPGGNPLVPGVAAYPFPSDFYLDDDPSTATGRRVALPPEALPDGIDGEALSWIDGFSRAPIIATWLPQGIDPTSLPAMNDPTAGHGASAPVRLLREDTFERVPLIVELDQHAEGPEEQALIVRPQVVLEPSTGYVVLLTDALRAADGTALEPSGAFRALRDGIATDHPDVEKQRGDFALVSQAMAAEGLAPDRVVQGWSFHTRSREQLHAPLLSMHDAAMQWPLDRWAIDSDEWEDGGQNRVLRGTFVAPDFLGSDDQVVLDAAGSTTPQGERDVPFVVTIPLSASSETRPVIAYGHGFFSLADEPLWGSLNVALHEWRMPAITTEFIGLSEDYVANTLDLMVGELSGAWTLASQQMQSQMHFTLLARLVSEQLASSVTASDGTPLLDGSAVHYMGISNGGTQGIPILAASPMFRRGALVVPGGAWSHLMQRAVQWNALGGLLRSRFLDDRELQLVLSTLQLWFDPIDALNWVEHLVDNRLPGREQAVSATLHEAVGDTQVHNLITEWIARSAKIPLIEPSAREVWSLDTVSAAPPDGTDVPAALYAYDEGYPPLPVGNVGAYSDNGAHDTIRDLPVYRQHVGTFLEEGRIVQYCNGPCDPE